MKLDIQSINRSGFTLVELLIVIAIIAILSVIVLVGLPEAVSRSRDAARLVDANQLVSALDEYVLKEGNFPANLDNDASGWDCNFDPADPGGFIEILETEGYMVTPPDPLNNLTSCYTGGMRYFRYGAGAYGCSATKGDFYILIIDDIETSTGVHEDSPGFSCPSRNWQTEGEWVTGKFQYPTR